jgi:hypothetical protein
MCYSLPLIVLLLAVIPPQMNPFFPSSDSPARVNDILPTIIAHQANRWHGCSMFSPRPLALCTLPQAYAATVNAQLAAGRRAYLEYSNEVWNYMFPQTRYEMDRWEVSTY